jgi:hypothetical protein
MITSHEAVDGLARLVLHAPGDQVCLVEAEAVTALPEAGLALVATEGLTTAPLPVAATGPAHPERRVRMRLPHPAEGTVVGTTAVTYTATDRFHLIDEVYELDVAGLDPSRTAPQASGAPVVDAETGAVLAVVATAMQAGYRASGFAVPLRDRGAPPPLAALLERNAATVPAFGPHLNLAGALQLTATSVGSATGPGPWREPVARPEVADVFDEFLGARGPGAPLVLGLVGEPGTGRSTELAQLAARRARGPRPAPTLWLRGAELRPGDGGIKDAVERALLTAARIVCAAAGPGTAGEPPLASPDAVAELARAAGRPLLVLLDAPEEMPPVLAHDLADWTAGTARWLQAGQARLVVACRPEFWEQAGALLPRGLLYGPGPSPKVPEPPASEPPAAPERPGEEAGPAAGAAWPGEAGTGGGGNTSADVASSCAGRAGQGGRARRSGGGPPGPARAGGRGRDLPPCLWLGDLSAEQAERARARYGLPPGSVAAADAAHPLALRLLSEVRAALAREPGPPAGRAEIFSAHLDLVCLRIAVRLTAASDPPTRGTAVRRLAALVAGQVHEAARRCLGPGQGELDREAFEELFPWRTGWASAVLTEGLLVPAGAGYRFAHEGLADWLQSLHLDLDAALHVLVHRWFTAPGAPAEAPVRLPSRPATRAGQPPPVPPAPALAPAAFPRSLPVPRHRAGPVVQALLGTPAPVLAAHLRALVDVLDRHTAPPTRCVTDRPALAVPPVTVAPVTPGAAPSPGTPTSPAPEQADTADGAGRVPRPRGGPHHCLGSAAEPQGLAAAPPASEGDSSLDTDTVPSPRTRTRRADRPAEADPGFAPAGSAPPARARSATAAPGVQDTATRTGVAGTVVVPAGGSGSPPLSVAYGTAGPLRPSGPLAPGRADGVALVRVDADGVATWPYPADGRRGWPGGLETVPARPAPGSSALPTGHASEGRGDGPGPSRPGAAAAGDPVRHAAGGFPPLSPAPGAAPGPQVPAFGPPPAGDGRIPSPGGLPVPRADPCTAAASGGGHLPPGVAGSAAAERTRGRRPGPADVPHTGLPGTGTVGRPGADAAGPAVGIRGGTYPSVPGSEAAAAGRGRSSDAAEGAEGAQAGTTRPPAVQGPRDRPRRPAADTRPRRETSGLAARQADAVWWAAHLVREVLLQVPDGEPYREVLRDLAGRVVVRAVERGGFRVPGLGGLGEFGPRFWRQLPVPAGERLDLLRVLLPADAPPNADGSGERFLTAVARVLRDDPSRALPAVCGWFDDDRPLNSGGYGGAGPAVPNANGRLTVASAAQALLHTHRRLAVDDLIEALFAVAHPGADEVLAALAEDEPSAVCRAVDRWAHDPRPDRHVAAAAYGPRVAPFVRHEADRELLRYAALAILARPGDCTLHAAALGLLVRDTATRSRHLPAALRHFTARDPGLPPDALVPALATHPEAVLAACRTRLLEADEATAEAVLAALATGAQPAVARRTAVLVQDHLRHRPEHAAAVARHLDLRLEQGPGGRAVLLPLVAALLQDHPPEVRRALAPVFAAPGTRLSRPIRQELLDSVLRTERDPEVLDALLTAAADGSRTRHPLLTRDLVHRLALLLGRTPEGALHFDRRLVELASAAPDFARQVREWLADGHPWDALIGPSARRRLDTVA